MCPMQNIKSQAFGSKASQASRALHRQPPVSWEGATEQRQGEPRGPPKMMAGSLGCTHSPGTVVGGCCAALRGSHGSPGPCMPPPLQGVATGVGWPLAWKINLSFPQTSPGAGDRLLPVPAPSAPEGARSSLRTREPESWESVTMSLGETLGSQQSSGGGSE